MPLYQITVTRSGNFSNVKLEKGMSVDVVVNSTNPIGFQNGDAIQEAFMRRYGVDLRKAKALIPTILSARKIN